MSGWCQPLLRPGVGPSPRLRGRQSAHASGLPAERSLLWLPSRVERLRTLTVSSCLFFSVGLLDHPWLRASPPPCTARPDPRGLSVGACDTTGRASRVASIPLFHACRRQYPGGNGRCFRRSLPDRWQPSPCGRRVGFRITGSGVCSAFTHVTARMDRPRRPFIVEVLQPMSLPPSSAPTATGWSDSCRAGFAPAEEWRLSRRTATGCYGCGIRDGTLPSRVGSICNPARSVATPMAGCGDGLRGCR